MFYYLHLLADDWIPGLVVFKSVTFRAAFGALFAFLSSVTLGPHFIRFLRERKIKEDTTKKDSEFLVQHHFEKRHTPTMGGLILMGSTLGAVGLFARPDVLFIPLAFFSMLTLGLIGFYDDWIKLTQKGVKGLSIRDKLIYQFIVGGGIGMTLAIYGQEPLTTTIAIPFVDAALWPVLGYAYIAWAAFIVTGTSNAVNLTDGLDGLATICTLTVAIAFGLMAYFAGHSGMANHMGVVRVPGAEELAIVCASLGGACLGFLWFNAHPAEIFMGDTGSLPLGGLIGLVALCIKQELMLALVGGVFVVEALSVLIQIASFRWFGRRVFLIAPLHHHLEKVGWTESKIVARFFIVSALLAVFSVALLRVS